MPPNYVHGNVLKSKAQLIVVTTNGVIRDGKLVMGAGAAKDLSERYSDIPEKAGYIIQTLYRDIVYQKDPKRSAYLYGYVSLTQKRRRLIGLLQTKLHWKDKASLTVIGFGLTKLRTFVAAFDIQSVAMNFPGIGLGGLDKFAVYPMLNELDERYTIHILEK